MTEYLPLPIPIFLQEMVLAVWLVARGFSPARAAAPEAATPWAAAPEAGVAVRRTASTLPVAR